MVDVAVRDLRREFHPGRGRGRRAPATVALDGIDLVVESGEIHGLLGPNGAGKTTLCKILSTLLLPTSGTALVGGSDVALHPERVRPLIGVVLGGERGLYGRLTARQTMRFWAALYEVPRREIEDRVERQLHRVGLAGRGDDRVETFSRGMKQRLHLARGMVGESRLLLLDEPTLGLDPVSTREFRTLVTELRDEGRTILLATHDMVEAEGLCDRVTLIDHGRILATESPAALGGLLSRYEIVEVRDLEPALRDELSGLPGVASVAVHETTGLTRIETAEPGAAARILARLGEAGVSSVSAGRPSLEEVYVSVIGDRGLAVG